jgi:Protein  of unknown function (DUF3018)
MIHWECKQAKMPRLSSEEPEPVVAVNLQMPNPAERKPMASAEDSAQKVARSRERMRAAGLRPVQFWVPDTRQPGFAAEVQRQCLALRGDAAQADAPRDGLLEDERMRAVDRPLLLLVGVI